jgi:hypothetical protein
LLFLEMHTIVIIGGVKCYLILFAFFCDCLLREF